MKWRRGRQTVSGRWSKQTLQHGCWSHTPIHTRIHSSCRLSDPLSSGGCVSLQESEGSEGLRLDTKVRVVIILSLSLAPPQYIDTSFHAKHTLTYTHPKPPAGRGDCYTAQVRAQQCHQGGQLSDQIQPESLCSSQQPINEAMRRKNVHNQFT